MTLMTPTGTSAAKLLTRDEARDDLQQPWPPEVIRKARPQTLGVFTTVLKMIVQADANDVAERVVRVRGGMLDGHLSFSCDH
jgi:hypothetical protein